MTELEAVNMMLRSIGSSPVNGFVEPLHPDVANARATLDRARGVTQQRGWWYNIDYNVTYSPTIVGTASNILVPKEITKFVATDKNVIKRNTKLYDKANQTYLFSAAVVAMRTVRKLEWDDLPDVAQDFAAYKANAWFIKDELEDDAKGKSLETDAALLLLDLRKQDLEEGGYNMFNKTRVAVSLARIRQYSAGRRRL